MNFAPFANIAYGVVRNPLSSALLFGAAVVESPVVLPSLIASSIYGVYKGAQLVHNIDVERSKKIPWLNMTEPPSVSSQPRTSAPVDVTPKKRLRSFTAPPTVTVSRRNRRDISHYRPTQFLYNHFLLHRRWQNILAGRSRGRRHRKRKLRSSAR
jgi:hypothetical protein